MVCFPGLKKVMSLRYILFCIIIATLVTMAILSQAVIGPGTVTSLASCSLERLRRFKFLVSDILYSNHTFRLLGRYADYNDTTSFSSDVVEVSLDRSSSRKLKESFLLEKRREYPYEEVKVRRVDCKALFDGNHREQNKTREIMNVYKRPPIPPDLYVIQTLNCDIFKLKRGYVTSPLTKEEEEFPIAYSILMFKDVEQTERLLRAIYRPQNVYCIHVDRKSRDDVRKAMTSIAGCFDNVFMSSRSVDVVWGAFSVLEPELICMKDLWKRKKWKYFINLTGQEFPLKTNRELVDILTAYDGANDMEATVKRANTVRWKNAGTPPHNITATKGSVHIVVNRDFVDYVLHNDTARDFLEWVKKVDVPDETFFSSLNHNPQLGIPGSYIGEPETDLIIKPFLARFKNWGSHPFNWPCSGKRVRLICVFGIGDLPLLKDRKELFANKFYWDYEPFTLDCMEELIFNRTRDEFLGLTKFDNSYYKTLTFVKNKV